MMNFEVESELEDGRWLAEVPKLPGVLVYGATRDEAMARAQVLALRVLAERLEHGESRNPSPFSLRRDAMAMVQCAPGLRGAATHRVATQASVCGATFILTPRLRRILKMVS